MNENGDKPRLKSADKSTLPTVKDTGMEPDMATEAVWLLNEARRLKARINEDEDSLSTVQEQLTNIALAYGLKGFRMGLVGFEWRGYHSRRTLDKGRLVTRLAEYGVPAEVIGDCYTDGAQFADCRLVLYDIE